MSDIDTAQTDESGMKVTSVATWKKATAPLRVPQALESVHAGFPSVAQDYFISDFSFDENIILHPDTTFAVRVAGDSMEGAGIYDGDILLVDRSLRSEDGNVVIAIIDGELTVKRLRVPHSGHPYLHPENQNYPDIRPTEETEFEIWGVVIGNYHFQHRMDF